MLSQTIAEIVTNDYRTATIFKKHGIDFCCGGQVSLQEVCSKKNIGTDYMLGLLSNLDGITLEGEQFSNPTYSQLGQLTAHIEEKHHTYVRTRLVEIAPFLQKVVKVHGQTYPFLVEVQKHFEAVVEELTSHMWKEEEILFPYINELSVAWPTGQNLKKPAFGSIVNPITMMESEHESAGNAFKSIRELTNDLTPPEGACNTFRITYLLLAEFEDDLHRHVHLENNVLFPKAIELEKLLIENC